MHRLAKLGNSLSKCSPWVQKDAQVSNKLVQDHQGCFRALRIGIMHQRPSVYNPRSTRTIQDPQEAYSVHKDDPMTKTMIQDPQNARVSSRRPKDTKTLQCKSTLVYSRIHMYVYQRPPGCFYVYRFFQDPQLCFRIQKYSPGATRLLQDSEYTTSIHRSRINQVCFSIH